MGRRARLRRVAIVTVATLVVIASVFGFVLFNNGASAATDSQVRTAFSDHVSNFNSGNATRMVGDYETNGTISWIGTTRGLGGSINSTVTIEKFYANFFSKITSVSLKNVTFTAQSSGSTASINGSMVILGSTATGSSIEGLIVADVDYIHVNNAWLISSETWSFSYLYLQPPLD